MGCAQWCARARHRGVRSRYLDRRRCRRNPRRNTAAIPRCMRHRFRGDWTSPPATASAEPHTHTAYRSSTKVMTLTFFAVTASEQQVDEARAAACNGRMSFNKGEGCRRRARPRRTRRPGSGTPWLRNKRVSTAHVPILSANDTRRLDSLRDHRRGPCTARCPHGDSGLRRRYRRRRLARPPQRSVRGEVASDRGEREHGRVRARLSNTRRARSALDGVGRRAYPFTGDAGGGGTRTAPAFRTLSVPEAPETLPSHCRGPSRRPRARLAHRADHVERMPPTLSRERPSAGRPRQCPAPTFWR